MINEFASPRVTRTPHVRSESINVVSFMVEGRFGHREPFVYEYEYHYTEYVVIED
jgi:hypothetical protein